MCHTVSRWVSQEVEGGLFCGCMKPLQRSFFKLAADDHIYKYGRVAEAPDVEAAAFHSVHLHVCGQTML